MSDLTRYREAEFGGFWTDPSGRKVVLVPDDMLQQIADKLPEIIRSLELSENGGDVLDNVRRLNALLDGLVDDE